MDRAPAFIPGLRLSELFHDRPYLVIDADRFVEALRAAIASEEVRRLPPHIGSVDQFVDSTDVLDNDGRFARLRVLYTETTPDRESTDG